MAPDTHATGSGAIMQERHRDLLDQTALGHTYDDRELFRVATMT